MSRGLNEFIEYLAGVIAADASLKTWCQTTFGQAHTVMVGVDPSDYPQIETYAPLVILNHGTRGVTDDIEMQSGSVRAACVIKDTNKLALSSGIWKHTGPQRLDDFTNLVMKLVLNSIKSDNYYFQSISSGPDDVIAPPLFQSFFGIEIQFDSDF